MVRNFGKGECKKRYTCIFAHFDKDGANEIDRARKAYIKHMTEKRSAASGGEDPWAELAGQREARLDGEGAGHLVLTQHQEPAAWTILTGENF